MLQTGQTTSFATGDDGDVQAGIKLPVPRFVDNGDGTVKDNLTHLTWLKDAGCFGLRKWVEALSEAKDLHAGEVPLDQHCGLTDGSVRGDWYLPNVKQYQSLFDYGYTGPVLTPGHPFAILNEGAGGWWTSTSLATNPSLAFTADFQNGRINYTTKISNLFFIAVRDGS